MAPFLFQKTLKSPRRALPFVPRTQSHCIMSLPRMEPMWSRWGKQTLHMNLMCIFMLKHFILQLFNDAIEKAVAYKKDPIDIEDQILEELQRM